MSRRIWSAVGQRAVVGPDSLRQDTDVLAHRIRSVSHSNWSNKAGCLPDSGQDRPEAGQISLNPIRDLGTTGRSCRSPTRESPGASMDLQSAAGSGVPTVAPKRWGMGDGTTQFCPSSTITRGHAHRCGRHAASAALASRGAGLSGHSKAWTYSGVALQSGTEASQSPAMRP
jgi:hypothetical protein